MDKTTFLTELFDHYSTDIKPGEYVLNRAVRKAEITIGEKMESIEEDSVERVWFENRVERYAIDVILSKKAEDFDYSKADLSQVFANFSTLRDKLDDDWKATMAPAAMRKRNNGGGMVIAPGFRYDDFGRARR